MTTKRVMVSKRKEDRRKFIKNASLGTLSAILGMDILFAENMPRGYIPLVLEENDPYTLFGKHKDMVILNDRPWNVEAQAHMLDDKITPADKIFIRNNGLVPENIDTSNWTLTIGGESVLEEKKFSLSELKSSFPHHTYSMVLECGGNGRSEYYPPTEGNQWTVGAVACPNWTGIRLRDLLEKTGLKSNAVYVGFYGADEHLSRDPDKSPISRGIPIAKAHEEETLLAFQMNGKDIPIAHGHPLRLVAGGYPASVCGKWLTRLVVRDKVHDGEKMESPSYHVPCDPVEPGAEVPDSEMCIIQSMPVKSLITYPKSGAMIRLGESLMIRGHAWAGELSVSKMEYSIDFGMTWKNCTLENPVNQYAWQHFNAKVNFPQKGYFEVWARATDSEGKSQPMLSPGWNPKGYINNACHRIAVKVG